MKIYFNSTFVETKRVTDDLWIKSNNGNKIEAYFEDLDLSNVNITLRLVIEWKNGDRTNELPMLKSYNNNYAYINLPTLKEAGEAKFIIRIFLNNDLSQTAIFTRVIKDNIEPNDNTNISSAEYEVIMENIEKLDSRVNSLEEKIESGGSSGGGSSGGGGTSGGTGSGGNVNVDLSNYYNKDETEALIDRKINYAIYDVITGDY